MIIFGMKFSNITSANQIIIFINIRTDICNIIYYWITFYYKIIVDNILQSESVIKNFQK